MSIGDNAYAEAVRLIAEAKREGFAELQLSNGLRVLPPEIGELENLRKLTLQNTDVTDLSHLGKLTELTELAIGGISRALTDIDALSSLVNLTKLSIVRSKLADLGPIASMVQLRSLNLADAIHKASLSPLKALVHLTQLNLTGNRRLSDISDLAELVNISELNLVLTSVTDLRPLIGLRLLADAPTGQGLTIFQTSLWNNDEKVREISSIQDNATRARALFAYLKDWVPPVPGDNADAPEFQLPEQGPMRSVDFAPVGGDDDQADLHEDMKRKSALLVEAIGSSNEMAILKGAAVHYRLQIDKPLNQIRLNLLYSAANSLRVAYEADLRAESLGRTTDMLPPKIAGYLKDFVETHSLFFMGFPNGADVHTKMVSGLTGIRRSIEIEASEAIVAALDGKAEVLEAEDQAAMADDLAAAKGEGASAEIGEKRLRGRIWNMLGTFARWAYRKSKQRAGWTAELVLANDFVAWFLGNPTIIGAWVKAAQGPLSGWYEAVFALLRGLM